MFKSRGFKGLSSFSRADGGRHGCEDLQRKVLDNGLIVVNRCLAVRAGSAPETTCKPEFWTVLERSVGFKLVAAGLWGRPYAPSSDLATLGWPWWL